MTFVIGAYAVYGSGTPEETAALVAGLADAGICDGLEVPFSNGAVSVPSGVPASWRHVVTMIPGTMMTMAGDPGFGLAATGEGRQAALDMARTCRDQVAARSDILAVEIHSAPRRTASADAFAESLAELAGWDWGGASLVVEHCDAWTSEHAVEKGFLTAEAELDAIASLGSTATPVRFGVNWARSVIETRDAATGAEHVRLASERGLLGGLMFSSVASEDSAYGGAWVDAHVPPRGVAGTPESSLLGADEIAATWAAATLADGGFAGLKVGLQPATLSPAERVQRLVATAKLVEQRG